MTHSARLPFACIAAPASCFARALLRALLVVVALTSVMGLCEAASAQDAGTRDFNLYFVATEELANRIVRHTETTSEPVVDFVLGARVRGQSQSTSQASMDFKPSATKALGCFCLNVEIQSDTVGAKQITLTNTLGRHTLLAAKPIFFDGKVVSTQRPRAAVVPRNFTRGVRTPVSGVPLVGMAVDQFVFSEVQKRRSQSERIAASKVLDRAVPEFNNSLDKRLKEMNVGLREKVQPWLQRWRLLPDTQLVSTTEKHLTYRASFHSSERPAISRLQSTAFEEGAIVVAIHESLLNAVVERQELAGKTLSDRQLDRWITNFAKSLQGQSSSDSSPEKDLSNKNDDKPLLATVLLDRTEPIHFRIADDALTLTLRLGIRPLLGDEIPPQPISIPLRFSVENGEVVVTPGKATVGDASSDDATKVPEIVRTLIRQQVGARLKELRIDGKFSIPSGSEQPVALSVTKIDANNGWLVLKLN